MQSFDIHPGQEYGYRDSPKRRDDLQRVKVIEKVRAKWKVEWVEPNPGLHLPNLRELISSQGNPESVSELDETKSNKRSPKLVASGCQAPCAVIIV
jgi:hypothetical protein